MLNEIRLTVMLIGAALAQWLGGFDDLISALVAFMLVDYVTGLFCAVVEKKLSSAVGFKGILQKCLILLLVGTANIIDEHLIEGSDHLLRTAVIFFYLSNEGISILENTSRLGLPVPDKFRDVLEQVKKK